MVRKIFLRASKKCLICTLFQNLLWEKCLANGEGKTMNIMRMKVGWAASRFVKVPIGNVFLVGVS